MLTKARSKLSKLYFPGLISLMFLPMLCIIYLLNDGSLQRNYRMELLTYDARNWKYWIGLSSEKNDIETYRKYTQVYFTGNPAYDAVEHVKLTDLLKRLNQTKDVINGISILYGPHAKYNELVSGIDDAYQSNNDLSVLLYHNKVLIWNYVPIKVSASMIPPCGGLHFTNQTSVPLDISEKIYNELLDFWPSVLAFIAMLWFSFSKKRYYLLRTTVQ